jgi:RNA polymerase sigma-70 factor (ECF subfamily)
MNLGPMNTQLENDERYERFLLVFSQDQHRVFAYIRSLVLNHADAQDVFQRCCVTLWRKFPEYDESREFLPWACRIAFNEVRNFMRVSARDRLLFDDELLGQISDRRLADFHRRDERLDALQQCIGSLTKPDRELVCVAYDDAATVVEFAKSTGRTLQSLYNRLTVLRRNLQECVERRMSLEEGAI